MRIRTIVLIASILLVSRPSFAQSLSPDQTKVRDEYLLKVVTLRHFYSENKLVFDEQGNKQGKQQEGPWTLFGKVYIARFVVEGKKVKLVGERTLVGPAKEPKQGLQLFRTRDSVAIEIGLASSGAEEMAAALQRIFLAPNDDFADIVPDYWKGFFRPTLQPVQGDPAKSRANPYEAAPAEPGKPPTRVRVSQGVLQGRALKQPRPVYPEIAKSYRQSGSVILKALITREGKISELTIIQPAGFGLDEAAIEAVKQWEYTPYLWNGEPMTVETSITVHFTLG